jgi:alkylhydroperoxidase/carboxymuconolactone decarboxylase family protein YurZ
MCENHEHRHPEPAAGFSDAFHTFLAETPAHADAWMEMAHRLEHATALDPKTAGLAYVSVLAALGLEGGIPLHVELAREAGATRNEVASAVLIGLPAAGTRVVHALPAALAAFDAVEPVRT